jgi:hypothetical protein
MRKRKKPGGEITIKFEVTPRDINEAAQLGLTGAQMIERSIARALAKMENVSDRKLAKRRPPGRPSGRRPAR